MTTAFERLGIAPTRDVRTIKRAYAVALKAIDQTHEREAFERLRQAYEQALAWAARGDEEEEEEEEEEQEDDEEDSDEEEDGGHRDDEAPAGTHAPADPETPDAPAPFAPPPAQSTAPFAPPPAQSPAAPVPPPQRPDETRQALQHWSTQLRDAAPCAVAALLEEALTDPRLLHLDSHAQLEARIAGLLHENPAGRAVLFDTAARRFHWTDRNARPIASTQAAQWISRVINQGLQWQAQTPAAIALQQQALATVARVPSPQAEQTRRFAEVLEHLASDFPDWFALHLDAQGHAHLPAWQAVHAKLAPRWSRQAARRERYFGTPRKTLNTVVGGLFVLTLVTALLSGLMNHFLGSQAPPAVAAAPARTGIGAPPATPEPVLAYEFTGAVTRDSCESAEEFVHESNWLQVDDSDAVALLATRAIRCQDKGLWSRKDDTLMACLRAERAAALAAGRPEEAQRCLKLDAAGK